MWSSCAQVAFSFSTHPMEGKVNSMSVPSISVSFLERASLALFSDPFLYSTKKLYPNNLVTHLCCMGVPTFWSNRYLRLCWSVLTTKALPSKYGLHFWTAETRANNSFPYVDRSKALPLSVWLWKAIGLPICIKIAPMVVLDASHSIVKGCVKFGRANTGSYVTASFNL